MKFRFIFPITVLLVALLFATGCTLPLSSPGTGDGGSQGSAPGSSETASGIDAAGNLVISPTDVVPSQNAVTVTVKEKDDITAKIPVFFDGGMGQIHVRKIEVTIYRADGAVETVTLGVNKGDNVEMQGTRQTDRIVVYVTFDNGTRLKTNDVTVAYRTRR